jgi:hypothetical protein
MTGRIRFSAAILAAAGLAFSIAPARGADFAVDPSRSQVDSWIALIIFCTSDCEPNEPIEFSGSVSAAVTLAVSPPHGVVVESLEVTGADLGLSDQEWIVDGGPYLFPTQGSGLRGTLVAPSVAGSVSSFGVSTFDLAGASLTIDTGTITTESILPPPLGEATVHDFAIEPATHVFGPGAIATASVSKVSPGFYEVELALPAVASFGIYPDPTSAIFALSEGEIVVTAVIAAPALGTEVPVPNWVPIAVGLMLFVIGSIKATVHSIPSRFNFL